MTTPPDGRPRLRSLSIQLPGMFVIIALVVGTALVVINPPFQAADEPEHFWRAWQITQGEFVSRQATVQGEQGAYLPDGLTVFSTQFAPIINRPANKTSARHILDSLKIPLDADHKTFLAFGNTAHYFPLAYLPQCLGIGLGRLFFDRVGLIFYFSRESNLVVFVLLGYLSLRAAPVIARPMFLLLLTPTMLSLAASVSGDTLTNASAALFTSLVCRYFAAGANSVNRNALLAFYLVSIPLSVDKFVYVPLLLLLFLIPARNFGGSPRKIAHVALLIVVNLFVLGLWTSATSSLNATISEDPNVSAPQQIAYLRQNPQRVPTLLWNTATDVPWFLCRTYVGVIGWIDRLFPTPLVIAWLLLLLLACWTADDGPAPPMMKTIFLIAPAIIASILFNWLLDFIYWTPVGFFKVNGLQGRYLFPLTPPFFLIAIAILRKLPGLAPSRPRDTALNLAAAAACLMMSAVLLYLVWTRFYA